jgi:hypothetical protein
MTEPELRVGERRVGEPLRDDPVSLAYYAGICTTCLVNPHQPGSPKCAVCWPLRTPRPVVVRQTIEVLLTSEECREAVEMGRLRNSEAKRLKCKDRHGFGGTDQHGEFLHIEGVAGEIVVARHVLELADWVPTVNTFGSKPDMFYRGQAVQVRTRGRNDWDLPVRRNDRNGHLFVLVTWNAEMRSKPAFRVHGYLSGADAKQSQWLQDYGKRERAYFVPQAALRPIEELRTK